MACGDQMSDKLFIQTSDEMDLPITLDEFKNSFVKEYNRRFKQLPEMKEYKKQYNNRPEVKLRNLLKKRDYNARPEIKLYKRKYMNERYLKKGVFLNRIRRNKFFDIKMKAVEYKGGKCVDCKFNLHLAALCFHHINKNEKEYSIKDLLRRGFEQAKPELDKCVLLCFNCHQIRHFKGGE